MCKDAGVAAIAVFASVVFCAAASADIIVDHQPYPFGGGTSDTEYLNDFGDQSWQRVADEVLLGNPAVVDRITWWGFYFQDNPPTTETMRITFYSARADGLPDESNVHWEQFVANPTRTATGRIILEGYFPREYFYEVDLGSAVSLDAGTLYWLEITQIGDPETRFRWEDSVTTREGFAFKNPLTHDWRHTVNTPGTMAFQLHGIPEPSMALLCFFTVGLATARRALRRMPGVKRK